MYPISALTGSAGGAPGGGGMSSGGGGGGSGVISLERELGELSLRPTAHMTLKPKTPGLLPQSALSTNNQGNDNKQDHRTSHVPHYASVQPPNQKPPSMAPVMLKDPPLVIKQISADKINKNKKEKGPSREEYMRRVRAIVESLTSPAEPLVKALKEVAAEEDTTKTDDDAAAASNGDAVNGDGKNGEAAPVTAAHELVEAACKAYRDIKLPDRLSADAAHALFAATLKMDGGLGWAALWTGVYLPII